MLYWPGKCHICDGSHVVTTVTIVTISQAAIPISTDPTPLIVYL